MNKYYIKKLIIEGEGKTTSTIDFSRKLTVISGPSNTGKTYIVKIIDYILGKKELDIDLSYGYTTFTLVLSVDNNDIFLSRKAKSKEVLINSEVKNIQSGTYSTDIDSENSLNALLLSLMGITDQLTVPSNSRYEMKRLSQRMILHSQIIYEDDIERPSSILLPKENTNQTYYLSHLLFLLYAMDFSVYNEQEDPKITKARKSAVKMYIQKKIASIQNELNKIAEKQTTIDQYEDPLIELYKRLEEINIAIQNAINRVQSLLKEITNLSDKLTQCELQIKSYETLKSQYISDINRLSFVLESTNILDDAISGKKESACPFCNSKFSQDDIDRDNLLTINTEVDKITNQLGDLISVIEDLYFEKKSYQEQLNIKREEHSRIEKLINSELKVQKSSLEQQIERIKTYIGLTSQLKTYESMKEECNRDLENLDKKIEKKKIYRPKDNFENDFQSNMTLNFKNILMHCNKQFSDETYFNLKEMDAIIDGQPKGNNGKGFRSYYNTIVILALRKYLNETAVYKPSFYIIDTPLHGFDQGELEQDENKSLRRKLYQYFVNTMNDTQLIIIDNENSLPENFNFDINGVTKTTFTLPEIPGRYGLFLDGKK